MLSGTVRRRPKCMPFQARNKVETQLHTSEDRRKFSSTKAYRLSYHYTDTCKLKEKVGGDKMFIGGYTVTVAIMIVG